MSEQTDQIDFVIADPLLPDGTIWKPTHIAHICKSHKPSHDQNLQKSAIYPSLTDLYRKGIHGIDHAYRVYRLVQEISDLENLDIKSKYILEFCAIFHDIGRINDDVDDFHGFRSIQILANYNFFELNFFNIPLVKYIIENHCINDDRAFLSVSQYDITDFEEAQYLMKLFKDADNLDRIRLGDFNPEYIRLLNSKRVIEVACKFFNEKYKSEEILNSFYRALQKCKLN